MITEGIALALYDEAFSAVRQKRSEAYRNGCRDYLLGMAGRVKSYCPYSAGTAECDAYVAGIDEGREILRQHSLKIADGEVTPQMATRAAQAKDRMSAARDEARRQLRLRDRASMPGQAGSAIDRFLAEKQAEATDHKTAAMPPEQPPFCADAGIGQRGHYA